MSQNVHPRLPPPGVPCGVIGHSSRSSVGVNNSESSNMNHTTNNSPQPASWGHSTNASNQNAVAAGGAAAAGGGLATNQHGAAPATPSAADYDKATIVPSTQSSSSSQGTTLKEHDLLGLSDVSSSNASKEDISAQRSDFPHEGLNLNLNLGATELRLGPKDDKLNSGGFQGTTTSTALETGSFLGLDAGGKGGSLDVDSAVQDRRSSNVDQSVANSEQQQEQGMDRGFRYSSLNGGDRASTQQQQQVGSRADIMESSGCRPLIESESLQKWHGPPADRKAANESLSLNMTLVQQQNLRPTQDESSEKKMFDRNYNEEPQELLVQYKQHAPADEHQVYSEWRERKQQHNLPQDDVSSSEKGSALDQVMAEKVNPLDLQQGAGAEQHERMDLEAYQVETRNFPDCKALVTLQQPTPEQRFPQDMSTLPSPRHADYVVQQKLWQSQMLMRSQVGVPPEFQQQQQQQMSLPPKDESSRNGFNGNFSGPRVFPVATKPAVSGAKRPFDTIGTAPPEARNFNESRVSSVSETPSMVNSNSATSDAEAKSKAQPSSYQSWGNNRAPTWQMLHTGGSFGPFPSQAPGRNQIMSNNTKPAAVDASSAGGETAPKAWESHSKSLQQQQDTAASISQKMGSSCPSENKPAPAQAPSPPSEAASAPRAAVGWPPLRSYRKNSIAAHPRPSPVETQQQVVRPPPPPPPQAASPASVASQPNSSFVKVYMDGVPFGRKVDLKTNHSYEKLSLALEDMFRGFVNAQQNPRELTLPSDKRNFLHGSDYVLTYEDQDGDLMLVGDVPWTMFIDTVKRLRIMKGSEAIGLGNRAAEKAVKLQPTV
ncbi:unnamed protein product [Calypogeia fissa]